MAMRIFFATAFALSTYLISAQTLPGVFAGGQATTAGYKINGKEQPTDFKFGAQAGFLLKIPFENQLYFSPAFYYSMKGYKVTLNTPSFPPDPNAKNNDTHFHTVDVAPLLQYDFGKTPSHFFVKFGPALEFAAGGTETFDLVNGQRMEKKMKFSFTDYGYVTISAMGQAGYEMSNGVFVFAHYAHGLGSANNADYGPKIKHRVIGLSVGKYLRR